MTQFPPGSIRSPEKVDVWFLLSTTTKYGKAMVSWYLAAASAACDLSLHVLGMCDTSLLYCEHPCACWARNNRSWAFASKVSSSLDVLHIHQRTCTSCMNLLDSEIPRHLSGSPLNPFRYNVLPSTKYLLAIFLILYACLRFFGNDLLIRYSRYGALQSSVIWPLTIWASRYLHLQ